MYTWKCELFMKNVESYANMKDSKNHQGISRFGTMLNGLNGWNIFSPEIIKKHLCTSGGVVNLYFSEMRLFQSVFSMCIKYYIINCTSHCCIRMEYMRKESYTRQHHNFYMHFLQPFSLCIISHFASTKIATCICSFLYRPYLYHIWIFSWIYIEGFKCFLSPACKYASLLVMNDTSIM